MPTVLAFANSGYNFFMTVDTWVNKTFNKGTVLSKVIKDRTTCIAITSLASAQLGLTSFGLNGWICPFRNYLACPCPGCGLTRAAVLMFKGDFRGMLAYHALAPFLVLALIVIGMGAFAPEKSRLNLVVLVEKIEMKTGIGLVFCVGLILYWLVRLLMFTDSYMKLVMS